MSSKKDTQEKWHVYMLECSDKTIYIGITNDLKARLAKHNSGKGAKYTRGRTPVVLITSWQFESKVEAAKEEYRLKQLSRIEKIQISKR